MKNTIKFMGGILLCLFVNNTSAQQTWDAKKNPTVDSITSQYEGKYITSKHTLTTDQVFPVIGKYKSVLNTENNELSITLDSENKGLVWIEGLPQGKIKAMLRKSPATYKIPDQKTEEGKVLEEGTLIFDKETNTLNICIGKDFNAEDPSVAFKNSDEEETTNANKSKTKSKVIKKPWMYTGIKIEKETAMK